MSEIKGQILGIILTIGVFTAVFATLTGVFKKTSESLQSKMNTAIETVYVEDAE